MSDNHHKTIPHQSGFWKPRVWKRKDGSMLVKCGCCEQKVVVYQLKDYLEINGVHASREAWAELLGFTHAERD